MTETYIIWRLNIWIKYILINNWQFTIRCYVNIDKDKIQRKLKVHEILLDIYFTTNGYPGRYYTVLRNTGVIPAIFGAKIGSVVGNNFLPKQV
jgi:hypothetical protein